MYINIYLWAFIFSTGNLIRLYIGTLHIEFFSGFNIALSYPHFFDGDPALLENVDGLKPLPQHETYFDINPVRYFSNENSII